MKNAFLVLALAVAPLIAQPKPDDHVQMVVQLKYADPGALSSLLRNFGVSIMPDQRMRVVALSGPRSAVETAEAAIKQLDVPTAAQKDIDLTVYFVVGTDENPAGNPIPQELQSTVTTLKQTFPFKNYYLLDALSLRTRVGAGAQTTGQLSGGRTTEFSVRDVSLEGDGATIRIDH